MYYDEATIVEYEDYIRALSGLTPLTQHQVDDRIKELRKESENEV